MSKYVNKFEITEWKECEVVTFRNFLGREAVRIELTRIGINVLGKKSI